MRRLLICLPLLVVSVALQAAETHLPEPIVERMFAYAGAFEVKGATREQMQASRFRSYAAIGNLLQRFQQVEFAIEYNGPSPQIYKSLLISLVEKRPPSPEWLVERVSVEQMGNLIVTLVQEGFFQGMNGARPMRPPVPHYLLSVRSTDGVLGYYDVLGIEPAEHDDRNGRPRPEIARRFLWLADTAAGTSFGELLKPLLPLQISIQTDRNEYRPGDSIWISGELRNTGKTRISASGLSIDPGWHSCRITDSKGQPIPMGQDFKNRFPAGPSDYFVLNPGESRAFRIDVTQGLLQPLAADTYRIGCHYGGNDTSYDPRTRTSRKVRYPWKWSTRSNDAILTVRQNGSAEGIRSPSSRP